MKKSRSRKSGEWNSQEAACRRRNNFLSSSFSVWTRIKGENETKNGGGGLRWAESDESMTAVQRGKKRSRGDRWSIGEGSFVLPASADESGAQNQTTS